MANFTEITDARVYVGTYGEYNNGSIYGDWYDLYSYNNAEELFEAVREKHSQEDDPEFMVQDFEGFPEHMYSESMGVEDLQKVYEYFEAFNIVDNPDAFLTYIEHMGITENFEAEKAVFEDKFYGEFESEADFAEQYLFECYPDADIPKFVRYYIDFEGLWYGSLRHDYTYIDGFVFRDY